jgi:hypothetical protein
MFEQEGKYRQGMWAVAGKIQRNAKNQNSGFPD